MIPNMLNETCVLGLNFSSFVSIVVMLTGFIISYYLGDVETNNKKIKSLFKKEG